MFYKLIELSRSFVRCSGKCQRYGDGANLLKDVIANALAHHKTKPDLKRFFFTLPKDKVHNILPLVEKKAILEIIAKELKQMQGILKENTIKVTKSCVSQFEFVLAHRVRRAQQVFSLYTKLWDDKALRVMVAKLRKQFMVRGRAFMLGLSAAAVINWDEEMIQDQDILRHSQEIEMCHRLKDKLPTNTKKKDDPQTCQACDSDSEDSCWEPFVASGGLTCWKREAPNRKGSGLFCYKMYGVYDDVSANDFLEAFLDIKERKTWDSHVVDLHIISSDPQSNSDLIYWETKWPTLFSNRDYVFKRRYKILQKDNIIVVMNKSSSHPNYPVNSSKTRVTEYWSYMVIKPFTSFSKPGIEFSLTYFDDPGTSLPSAISSWASTTGMPEFMKKLRLAAKKVADTRLTTPVEELDQFSEVKTQEEKEQEDDWDDDIQCETPSIFGFVSLFYPPRDEDALLFQMLIS